MAKFYGFPCLARRVTGDDKNAEYNLLPYDGDFKDAEFPIGIDFVNMPPRSFDKVFFYENWDNPPPEALKYPAFVSNTIFKIDPVPDSDLFKIYLDPQGFNVQQVADDKVNNRKNGFNAMSRFWCGTVFPEQTQEFLNICNTLLPADWQFALNVWPIVPWSESQAEERAWRNFLHYGIDMVALRGLTKEEIFEYFNVPAVNKSKVDCVAYALNSLSSLASTLDKFEVEEFFSTKLILGKKLEKACYKPVGIIPTEVLYMHNKVKILKSADDGSASIISYDPDHNGEDLVNLVYSIINETGEEAKKKKRLMVMKINDVL